MAHWNVDTDRITRTFSSSATCKDLLNSFSSSLQCLSLKYVKKLKEDLICNDASPPNSFELKEDLMYNDANPKSYVSPNPEPSIKYAAASSSPYNYCPFKSDDTLKTSVCSAATIVPINTPLLFISFEIFLLIKFENDKPTKWIFGTSTHLSQADEIKYLCSGTAQ